MTGVRFFHAQNRVSGLTATTTVWQDADGAGTVWSLGESNLLIQRSGSSSVSAISSTRVVSGNWFIQLQFPVLNSQAMYGICRIAGTPTNFSSVHPGAADSESVALYALNGMLYNGGSGINFNGVNTSDNVAWSANDVITIMVNAGNSQVRFRRNSGVWSSPITLTGTGGAFYFCCAAGTGSSTTSSARILQPNSAAWVAPDATLNGYSYWI